MNDWEQISMAREDVVEWFDWNRHRIVTPLELAGELEMLAVDMEVVLSQLLLSGEIEQHASGYHRAVHHAATQVRKPLSFQAFAAPPERAGATDHAGITESQEKLE
jgi:hypothetical protein